MDEALAKTRAEKSQRRLVSGLELASFVYAGAGDLGRASDVLAEAERVLGADPRASSGQQVALADYQARLALARGDSASAVSCAKPRYSIASYMRPRTRAVSFTVSL